MVSSIWIGVFKMYKIAILCPYKKLADYANLIGKKLENIHIQTFIGYFDEGVKLAKEAESKGYDAIIARGITYNRIKEQVNIPVVNAQESVHDLIRALYKVRGCGYKVNLFLYENNLILVDQNFNELLNDIFDINLTVTKYGCPKDLELYTKKLSKDFDAFIGGAYVEELSKEIGIKSILWETGYDTLYLKIKECIDLIKTRHNAIFQRNQLKTILDHANEGIIYVDNETKIRMMNPIAKKIIGIKEHEDVTGKFLTEFIPDKSLNEVIQTGVGQYQEYQKIGKNVQIISNKVPVKIKNKVEGAVVNFKEIEQVIEMEKKIRAELWKKKSVAKYSINDIAGISKKITEAKELVRRFGKFDSNVLIWGETGTGKELFAQSIHNESKRKNEPFYAINCATLPENLLESELFGYAEGSFTGAKKGGKAGLFELAHNGTLFLDEIGDMPLSFQSKLLRALQEKEIRRIGDDKLISVDVRIIAASNKNLYHEVLKGNFREDLYYRIDVMNLKIPPLRERREDIPYLIEYFMKIYKKEFNSNRNYVCDDNAMNCVKNYMCRGNVRELQNFVERI